MFVKYWLHNNMVTLNGQKMGKSLGNAISLEQFFNGSHPLLTRTWSPAVIRFFLLQSHYRGTTDFSETALEAEAAPEAKAAVGAQHYSVYLVELFEFVLKDSACFSSLMPLSAPRSRESRSRDRCVLLINCFIFAPPTL
jgi:isoleucyl-tRNA synthetase